MVDYNIFWPEKIAQNPKNFRLAQVLGVDFSETTQKAAGQTLSALSETHLTLRRPDSEIGVFVEGFIDFGDEYTSSVIEDWVESFQDALTGQIEVVQKDPKSFLQSVQKDPILPFES